jgi:hypothetical protein
LHRHTQQQQLCDKILKSKKTDINKMSIEFSPDDPDFVTVDGTKVSLTELGKMR